SVCGERKQRQQHTHRRDTTRLTLPTQSEQKHLTQHTENNSGTQINNANHHVCECNNTRHKIQVCSCFSSCFYSLWWVLGGCWGGFGTPYSTLIHMSQQIFPQMCCFCFPGRHVKDLLDFRCNPPCKW